MGGAPRGGVDSHCTAYPPHPAPPPCAAGVRVVRPAVAESTACGAAYAAGLAVGVWADTGALRAQWRSSQEWAPRMPRAEAAAVVQRWETAVRRSFGWEGLAPWQGVGGGAGVTPEAAASAAATAAAADAGRGGSAHTRPPPLKRLRAPGGLLRTTAVAACGLCVGAALGTLLTLALLPLIGPGVRGAGRKP